MPRDARKKSESGIYHTMLRGINKQQIFEDEEDNERFIENLHQCKAVSGFELYAYCLMGNHVHLLIREANENLEQIFKRIGVRYALWYNWKYKRVGHLFQDRFRSEPVNDDRYFLTVLRYIHQNPVKAGICVKAEEYRWSSYGEYFGGNTIIDCDMALSIIGLDEFIKHSNETNKDECLENIANQRHISDADIKVLMMQICGSDTVEEFLKFDKKSRNLYLSRLKEKGISLRNISRLTGVSKSVVERA